MKLSLSQELALIGLQSLTKDRTKGSSASWERFRIAYEISWLTCTPYGPNGQKIRNQTLRSLVRLGLVKPPNSIGGYSLTASGKIFNLNTTAILNEWRKEVRTKARRES